MRRVQLGVIVALTSLLAIAGCTGGSTNTTEASSSPAASDTGAGFPATVETKFGKVTIEKKPTKVVALGWGDAETALALGVQPIGASDWMGFGGEGVGPWAAGLYDKAPTIIQTMEPSYEQIAALKPDLILDVKGSGEKARYDRLTQIAPTVGVSKKGDNYLTTPTEQMTMISTALGQPEKGKELLAEVEKNFADAAAAHPQWKGKTATAATRTAEGWGAYIEGSDRVTFLEKLGFVQNPKVAALPTASTGFSVNVSPEQLDVMDADLVTAFPIFIDKAQITDDPSFKAIPAVAAGHSVVIDGDLASAYSLGTTLATNYAIEKAVPLIETATK